MKKSLMLLIILIGFYVNVKGQLPSYVPTNGLVGYWPFNGNANDISGNNLNGIVSGATLTSDRMGNNNCAYKFDYLNWSWGQGGDEIYIPYNSILNTTNLSVSVWAYRSSNGYSNQSHTIINRFQYGYSNPQGEVWQIIASPAPSCSVLTQILQPNLSNIVNSGTSLLLNNWKHIVFTYDGISFKQYENGILQSNSAANSFMLNTIGNSGISIGVSKQANGNWGPFDGKIDDIGIWNRALTQSEIAALYNSQTVAVSDTLWVANTQSDTLTYPSQVKLSIKSNNITSKNISAYDIKLNYDSSRLKFDSVTKTNTVSAIGSLIINSTTPGQVVIGWASSTSITSSNLPLLDCYFTPIDSGKTTVSISNAILNTDTVKNRYSKSVITMYNFGDVDMNKIVQSYDASLVLKYSVGIDPLPTIDPLPWEAWRVKVANVDTSNAVNANDASLILKYSVGLITKFPKRGPTTFAGYVTLSLENKEIVVRSYEDMGGLNISFLDHLSDLSSPSFIYANNTLSAFNKQSNLYKLGLAFSEAPANGTIVLRIPYTGSSNQTLDMEIVENTASRNYQLSIATGLNNFNTIKLNILPNPTNQSIHIDGLTIEINNSAMIYSIQGQLLKSIPTIENNEIDLSEFNPGVYLIKINDVAHRVVKL